MEEDHKKGENGQGIKADPLSLKKRTEVRSAKHRLNFKGDVC